MTAAELRSAASALENIALRTPLVKAPSLSQIAGQEVRLKAEQLQPIGAFKIRGAWTAVNRLSPADRARGIITHSSGNHGRALAWAGQRAGLRTVVVMPDTAPDIKVAAVRALGAEVVLVSGPASERGRVAVELSESQGLVLIPPYEHPDVILGQATATLEIFDSWPEVEAVVAPVGGGGLLAGACIAALAVKPEATVIAVEPVGAAKLSVALHAGHPVPLHHTTSLADGLLPMQIGAIPFATIEGCVRTVVTVTDAQISAGVRFLFTELGMKVEPSGAVTVAAVLAGLIDLTGPTALILSGGNVDPDLFAKLLQ